jgi:Flp pilus assembly protein protease CpaA
MLIDMILLGIAFIALIAGTITDIKTREVPDWINYGIMFSGIGLRLIYTSVNFEWIYLLEGIAGFGICIGIGYAMFYAGQWGGGDSKLLMGLGALIGLSFKFNPMPLLIVFLFNILLVGSVYGLFYSAVLAVKERKKFAANFKDVMHDKKLMRFRRMKFIILSVFLILLIIAVQKISIDFFVLLVLIIMMLLLYLSFYLVVFVKAVEMSAMFKDISPEQLTEGDWIAKDIVVNKKIIARKKDLGVSKEQIKKLVKLKEQGKIDKIQVKYGMPFVPSFLLAFILSVCLGAWWLVLF